MKQKKLSKTQKRLLVHEDIIEHVIEYVNRLEEKHQVEIKYNIFEIIDNTKR